MRLRRVSPDSPGWTRRRVGRGFVYLDQSGTRLVADDVVSCKALAIPPAWVEVWISPHRNGHIQAVGTDAAGRRQYLYHPQWRGRRDVEKHERVLTVGRRLPAARRRVAEHLAGDEVTKQRAMATAFMLLDLGLFRVGGETYTEQNGSYGLATVEKRHVHADGDAVVFDYPAKSGQRRVVAIDDAAVGKAVNQMRRRRGGGAQLLAYRDGRRWRDVTSRDINDYVKEILGHDVTPKDFRTWHATVAAATALADEAKQTAASPKRPSPKRPSTKSSVRRATEQVAALLGNTPSIARKSYIDPRITERFEDGETITPGDPADGKARRRREPSVLRLLADDKPPART